MSEMEMAALGIGAIFLYICAVVLAICLALAPLFCWIHLRNIRRQQEADSDMLDEHLEELRESVKDIEFTLGKILNALEKQP